MLLVRKYYASSCRAGRSLPFAERAIRRPGEEDVERRLGGRRWLGHGRRWVVALSSVAVVACGPALSGGASVWRERDRLAEWTATWMPFLPPAHPASDPRARALVEALTAELALRTA